MQWKFLTAEESAQLTPVPRLPVVRADHPVMSPDGRALWDGDQGWFWVLPEIDGESFYVSMDAEGPYPPWMQFIDEAEGLHSAMFPDAYDGAQLARELLEMGVAPDQPFFVHLTFEYHRGDGWETDDEMIVGWEVRAVEPLDPAEAARRWAEWLDEWRRDPP
jgi:hypothetical protein